MSVLPTPAQTVGPFFRIGFEWLDASALVEAGVPGAIRIEGRVLDGRGDPVPDAVLEIFQADGAGRFPPDTAPGWSGFGRCLSDHDGGYHFVTVKPGAPGAGAAPHVDLSLFARGLLQRVVSRIYFADESPANSGDPVLAEIGEAAASTLLAHPDGPAYRFDVHLQGEQETAFFAW